MRSQTHTVGCMAHTSQAQGPCQLCHLAQPVFPISLSAQGQGVPEEVRDAPT